MIFLRRTNEKINKGKPDFITLFIICNKFIIKTGREKSVFFVE